MGAQSQRRVLSRLIENMSDEELSQVTKMAKDEMNRRVELSEGFTMISEPELATRSTACRASTS